MQCRASAQTTTFTETTEPIFFFNDTATTEIYTLSLHDALPISEDPIGRGRKAPGLPNGVGDATGQTRSEEHTSELQSRSDLVCRLLLEKKKYSYPGTHSNHTGPAAAPMRLLNAHIVHSTPTIRP